MLLFLYCCGGHGFTCGPIFIILSSSPSEIGSIVHKFPRWMMNVFWSLEKLQQSRNSDETRFNFSKQSTWKTWQNRDLTFPSTCHSTWHMAAGQTRPKANTNLTFTNTCQLTWHMANTAQGKHEFNFYKHIPQHMAHGSRATGKKGINFYKHVP